MEAKTFHKLPNGTKIEVCLNDSYATGEIVTTKDRTSRREYMYSRVKIVEAEAGSYWAKYIGNGSLELHFSLATRTI